MTRRHNKLHTPTEQEPTPMQTPLSRRQALRLLSASAAVGAAAVTGACSIRSEEQRSASRGGGADPASDSAEGLVVQEERLVDPPRLVPGAVAGRVLVLIELAGGNDGLSTVIPYTEGFLHDVRGNLRVPDEEVLRIDDRIGLAPQLERLHRRGITIVEGVGTPDHTLSHFAMERRWQRGDASGTDPARYGYLGRLSDAVDQGGIATGLSVAGTTPWLHSASATTLSLQNPNSLWIVRDSDWDMQVAYLDALDRFADVGLDRDAVVTGGYADLRTLANQIGEVDDEPASSEASIIDDMSANGGELAYQLMTAADLIAADVGIRLLHAQLGGFDTHDDHEWAHPNLLGQMDAAIDGFLRLMEARGLGDRVLVATASEFGRRVRQNGRGLDHGAASTMLVAGPVPPRLLGEPSPVAGPGDLDDDGNLRMTTGMDSYLGSLAQEWLGVEAASILPTDPTLLGLI